MKIIEKHNRIKKLQKYLKSLNGTKISAGIFEEDMSGPHPEVDNGETLGDIATALHFGVPTEDIPARPFVSKWFDDNEKMLQNDLKDFLYDLIVESNLDMDNIIETIGEEMSVGMKSYIDEKKYEPNSQSTLNQKSGSTPLKDSGYLYSKIKHEIKRGK